MLGLALKIILSKFSHFLQKTWKNADFFEESRFFLEKCNSLNGLLTFNCIIDSIAELEVLEVIRRWKFLRKLLMAEYSCHDYHSGCWNRSLTGWRYRIDILNIHFLATTISLELLYRFSYFITKYYTTVKSSNTLLYLMMPW